MSLFCDLRKPVRPFENMLAHSLLVERVGAGRSSLLGAVVHVAIPVFRDGCEELTFPIHAKTTLYSAAIISHPFRSTGGSLRTRSR